MKESPGQKSLHENLKPGKLSSEGFLGNDTRSVQQIIDDDGRHVESLGTNHEALACRMQMLTEAGAESLGRPITIEGLEVTVIEDRGIIPCPFRDHFSAFKRLTQVSDLHTGRKIQWTDLNIHLIGQHGFYEGEGASFRVDPAQLTDIIGIPPVSTP